MKAVLELEHVKKRRGAGATAADAIRDVSLAVNAAEVVLLEGPSGSGKTTLLALAAGLLTPDAGEVRLAGRSLGRTAAARRQRRATTVGFVFQRGNLLTRLSARDNVLFAALQAGLSRDRARAYVERLLERLGIAELGDRRPGEMSGGQEQRVSVARALVHRPALVLADEPTGNLDGASGQAVAEALAELAQEQATAVLIATHDARLAPYASRRVRLVDGTLP
jgi:putative ABC transport system ATP-binding protein